MAASARLVVQMTPKEKKALETRAKRAGIRRPNLSGGASPPTICEYREDIEGLLATLEASAPAILRRSTPHRNRVVADRRAG